jgi:branched-chain amino acid transport system substrate-binding protein
VRAGGGKVLGAARHPIDTNDFSSYVLQAQASKAKVVGVASAGAAAINTIKTADEFGLKRAGQTLAGLYFFITDVHSLGLQTTQDMIVTTAFYWDQNEETRGLVEALLRADKAHADATSGRQLFSDAPLPQGHSGRGHG